MIMRTSRQHPLFVRWWTRCRTFWITHISPSLRAKSPFARHVNSLSFNSWNASPHELIANLRQFPGTGTEDCSFQCSETFQVLSDRLPGGARRFGPTPRQSHPLSKRRGVYPLPKRRCCRSPASLSISTLLELEYTGWGSLPCSHCRNGISYSRHGRSGQCKSTNPSCPCLCEGDLLH